MASINQNPVTRTWEISFWFGKKQFHKSLKTIKDKDARALKGSIERTLRELEEGRRELPPEASDPKVFWQFVLSDGKFKQPKFEKATTLGDLLDRYFAKLPTGAKEPNTIAKKHVHERHLLRVLGRGKPLPSLSAADLQEYISKRSNQGVGPETIKKEIATLGTAWRWVFNLGGATVPFPVTRHLVYPRGKEKPDFQTWKEIEKAIARRGLTKDQKKELWDCLFLSLDEIDEILEFLRNRETRSAYFYPLIVFIADTGSRLSEVIRSQVEDFRFDQPEPEVVLREKKRKKDKDSFRRVPMTPRLYQTMKAYFESKDHPRGIYTICKNANEPMKESTLHEAFEWALRNSKWQVLKGYHVFRHSMASNLAAAGIAQWKIDAILGHHTVEMQKRYRHLFPDQRVNVFKQLRNGREENGVSAATPQLLPG